MAIEVITREDLNEFRSLLLNDLKEIIQSKPQQTKQWLKSNEVRKLLNISPGTLQNLRINGTLTYTKVGGIMYYDNSDIDKLLNGNKVNARKDLAIYKINQSDLQNERIDVAFKVTFDYPEQSDYPPKNKDLLFDVEGFFEYKNHFYLFTKNRSKGYDGSSYIYKIPNKSGHHHAQLIKTILTCSDYHNCAITSAAISPDGLKFVLLSHSKIWLFENYSQENIATGKMTELNLNHFSQKEAICFKNEEELFIADEKVKKTGGNLLQVNLQSLK